MNNPSLPCPHCGSTRLVASPQSRRIFIDHDGDRIPLLTVNFNLDRPVLEETTPLYSCGCSWIGTKEEMHGQP